LTNPKERAVADLVFNSFVRGHITNLLLDSIDEVLGGLLGTRVREAVYDHLERNYLLGRTEIPERLNDFFSVLEKTFGGGAKTIGKAVARKLYVKLDWKFIELPDYEFADYWSAVKPKMTRQLTTLTVPREAQGLRET
jgi:hypothetical protein